MRLKTKNGWITLYLLHFFERIFFFFFVFGFDFIFLHCCGQLMPWYTQPFAEESITDNFVLWFNGTQIQHTVLWFKNRLLVGRWANSTSEHISDCKMRENLLRAATSKRCLHLFSLVGRRNFFSLFSLCYLHTKSPAWSLELVDNNFPFVLAFSHFFYFVWLLSLSTMFCCCCFLFSAKTIFVSHFEKMSII